MSGDVVLLVFDIVIIIALLGAIWIVTQLRSRIEAATDYARANDQDIANLWRRQLNLKEDVRKIESDIRPLIRKPSNGTRVTVRGDRSNPVGYRLDPDKIVAGSFDMSKIKATTEAPLKIFSFQKHPQVTVSMLDEVSYAREFGRQRDTGETTITIGVKHD